jgi:hypothetical protein
MTSMTAWINASLGTSCNNPNNPNIPNNTNNLGAHTITRRETAAGVNQARCQRDSCSVNLDTERQQKCESRHRETAVV